MDYTLSIALIAHDRSKFQDGNFRPSPPLHALSQRRAKAGLATRHKHEKLLRVMTCLSKNRFSTARG
jgi:hypothetical protein